MMKQHVYKFEFNYSRMVNGKKTKFVIPIVVHDVGFADACCRVDEHVKKNFGYRVSEDSSIKYVGEFVHGVLKPFVEVKEEKQMKSYDEMYEEMNGVHKKVELLEKRVEKFERGWFDPSNLMYHIKNTQQQIFDINSMYPQMVDVCKVYQLERDQALKENEALQERIDWISADSEKVYENLRFTDTENARLLIEVSGYKKELSKLNLLMDDMEDRLDKQVVAREGMLKQLREYKAEKKRMNKIIDALTEDK